VRAWRKKCKREEISYIAERGKERDLDEKVHPKRTKRRNQPKPKSNQNFSEPKKVRQKEKSYKSLCIESGRRKAAEGKAKDKTYRSDAENRLEPSLSPFGPTENSSPKARGGLREKKKKKRPVYFQLSRKKKGGWGKGGFEE